MTKFFDQSCQNSQNILKKKIKKKILPNLQ